MKKQYRMVIAGFIFIISTTTHSATITAFAEITTNLETVIVAPPPQTSGNFAINVIDTADTADVYAFVGVGGALGVGTTGTYGLGVTTWNLKSEVSWSDTFTNSSGANQNWSFDYLVTAGSVYLSMLPGADAIHTFGIDISIDGNSVYFTSLVVTPDVITETGGGLGGSEVISSSQGKVYDWESFTGSIDFMIAAQSSSTLTYTMTDTETVNITDFTAECGGNGNFFGAGGCTSVSSGGDPFGTSVISNVAQSAVPIPSALWLFGSGLLGLVSVARCKV